MNYIICDDDNIFAEDLAEKIRKIEPDCSITMFNSLSALVFNMEDIGFETDAVFMDIDLKDGNGINAAVSLINKFPALKIVYVTGFGSKYSQAIFECPQGFEPVAFLIKPVNEHYLRNALLKLNTVEKGYDNIVIKSAGELVVINPKDLIFVSCRGRKLNFHTAKGDYEINGRLSTFLEGLPDFFVRTEKSYIINISHIVKISDWKNILMSDNSECPLSRTYCSKLKQLLITNKTDLRKV